MLPLASYQHQFSGGVNAAIGFSCQFAHCVADQRQFRLSRETLCWKSVVTELYFHRFANISFSDLVLFASSKVTQGF